MAKPTPLLSILKVPRNPGHWTSFIIKPALIHQNMQTPYGRKILFVKVVGELLFLFGLLGWLNGVLIQFTYPMVLAMPASYIMEWIRLDTLTILAFIISAVGFFIWRICAELIKFEKEKT